LATLRRLPEARMESPASGSSFKSSALLEVFRADDALVSESEKQSPAEVIGFDAVKHLELIPEPRRASSPICHGLV